jgi:hypothetical protein
MKTSRSIAEQVERKQARGDEKKPAETPRFLFM